MTSLSLTQPCAVLDGPFFLTEKTQTLLSPSVSGSLPYLVVSPDLFSELLNVKLKLVDQVPLREPGKHYQESPETNWPEYHGAFCAQVWQEGVNAEKIIYLPHNGRLYRRVDIIEAASLIVYLQQEEEALAIHQLEAAI